MPLLLYYQPCKSLSLQNRTTSLAETIQSDWHWYCFSIPIGHTAGEIQKTSHQPQTKPVLQFQRKETWCNQITTDTWLTCFVNFNKNISGSSFIKRVISYFEGRMVLMCFRWNEVLTMAKYTLRANTRSCKSHSSSKGIGLE